MPSYGFFIRHVKGIQLNNITMTTEKPDARPPFVLDGVRDAEFNRVRAARSEGVPNFLLRDVEKFSATRVDGATNTMRDRVAGEEKL